MVLISCLTFTACSNDIDEIYDVEPITNSVTKNLYFYGTDVELAKLNDVDFSHIKTEKQLKDLVELNSNPYVLIVGEEIDIRSGIIDDLRNSGILITQLEGEKTEKKPIPEQTMSLLKIGSVQNEADSSGDVQANLEDKLLYFTSYLFINGERKILDSSFENMKQAVSGILQWEEEKKEDSKGINFTKSTSNKVREVNLAIDIYWSGVANFSIDTEVYKTNTSGYMLNTGSGSSEYARTYIYEHNITATPTNYAYSGWTVDDVQIWQQLGDDYAPMDFSLREYSPINSSNGVLSGSSGSDSWGYNVNVGIASDGISGGGGLDWSHSTDWSYPACQINTYHDPANEIFNVLYDVDPNGSWAGNSVTVKDYTIYSHNGLLWGADMTYTTIPMSYITKISSSAYNYDKVLHVMAQYSKLRVWKFPYGYNNPAYSYTEYSW